LKPDDIPFLLNDIKNEMPRHYPEKFIVPQTKGLPKDYLKQSHKVDNKYLNNHLSEIEEAQESKLLSKELINSFKGQQSIHKESGILNHDNFFNEFGDIKGTFYSPLNLFDTALVGVAGAPAGCTGGSTVEVGGTVNNAQASADELHGYSVTLVNGSCYDQIAQNVASAAAGNSFLGLYEAGSPIGALATETGTHSTTNGFDWVSCTEYTTDTTSYYLGQNSDSAAWYTYYNALAGRRYYRSVSGMPDPYGSASGPDATDANLKVGHS
jgi:hypothetical protein